MYPPPLPVLTPEQKAAIRGPDATPPAGEMNAGPAPLAQAEIDALWVEAAMKNDAVYGRAIPVAPAPTNTGHPGFMQSLDEIRALHILKSADYGLGADLFANVRASADFGVPPWVGTMVRANDKMIRIKSFIAHGSLKNESLEDSLKDLAAYSLIALALFREQTGGGA